MTEFPPWEALRAHIDEHGAPWPPWLPPPGVGVVAAVGHEPVAAIHLGCQLCVQVRAGDIIGVNTDCDTGETVYVRVSRVVSNQYVRELTLDVPDGWATTLSMGPRELISTVWRPDQNHAAPSPG